MSGLLIDKAIRIGAAVGEPAILVTSSLEKAPQATVTALGTGGNLSAPPSFVDSKLVRRTAPAEGGVISLPIQTWAITKVRLKKTGKTKVHLKVIYEGQANGFEEWAKAVQLRKKQG